ncbi:SGNH/GDSL hydrolase family protein [Methylobacterium gnaphalii]|uniref:SGNH/GDSL hydrolase family protein n=2 Tax=Methylobacterium gnaphalii TaxID=1010610 RepID=UPI0011BE102D|nr:SGNH/GDSL hydrolase family protein [Methylobacterium gnaphalii]
MRFSIVQQYLDEADPGFILFAGDSNAELHSTSGSMCGRTVANVATSGATTQSYADFFEKLSFPVRPRAAVLTIGTNDLNRKKDPRGARSGAAFETALDALLVRMRSITETVLVTAVPPVDHNTERSIDPLAVGDYSKRIQAACERLGCRFIDPFASLREGDTGYGLANVNQDGKHLKRYKPVFNAIGASLCPDGRLQDH